MNKKDKLNELFKSLPGEGKGGASIDAIKSYLTPDNAKKAVHVVVDTLQKQARYAEKKLKKLYEKFNEAKDASSAGKEAKLIRATIDSIRSHLPADGQIPDDSFEGLKSLFDKFLIDWQALSTLLNTSEQLDEKSRLIAQQSADLVAEIMREILIKLRSQLEGINDSAERDKSEQWLTKAESFSQPE
jgi:uncharacterized tellurite resistance protein B-like protein